MPRMSIGPLQSSLLRTDKYGIHRVTCGLIHVDGISSDGNAPPHSRATIITGFCDGFSSMTALA